jgi:hypothetical protein
MLVIPVIPVIPVITNYFEDIYEKKEKFELL